MLNWSARVQVAIVLLWICFLWYFAKVGISSFFLVYSNNNDASDEYRRAQYAQDDEDILLDGVNIREENIQEDIDYDDGLDNSEDEVEGEDLMENMEQDYREQ